MNPLPMLILPPDRAQDARTHPRNTEENYPMMKKPAILDAVNAVVFLGRAEAYLHHKQFERALADVEEALRLNPQLGDAWMVRATLRVELGNYREALADVQRRLQMEPPEPLALLTRGNLHAQLGELESALVDFTDFLRQRPGTVLALRARAGSYARLHRFEEALADLQEALGADPTKPDAWLDRGHVYHKQGNYPAALADYQKALELGPTEARIYNQYAWLLAACPQPEYRDGVRAVELARRGCELTNWRDANILDTLASAYAECGQFDEAVVWASKALELAEPELKEAVGKHIELFRNGQPARS
jgi:tetratricopeptide (TPR) repeat protein